MTPKEKAIELVSKYSAYTLSYSSEHAAKQCALIAVDEILESAMPIWDGEYSDARNDFEKYWNEVKAEIENI